MDGGAGRRPVGHAAPVQLPDVQHLGRPVAHRRRLQAAGVSDHRIRTAVRGRRWQQPLPGVVVGHTGPLTRVERWQAALEYGGERAALSHRSALLLHGARVGELDAAPRPAGVRGTYVQPPEGGLVEVTVPHGHHLTSAGFVVVHQSRRAMETGVRLGGLRVCPPARAAVDVAVTVRRRSDVEHVVADVLQRGLCTVADLCAEAVLLGRRRTPWLDQALRDAARGMRSVGEADLRRVVLLGALPEPEWGAVVPTEAGTYEVDALWRRQRVVAEADGRAFHLSAADWTKDLARQNAIVGQGLTLLRWPVHVLRRSPLECAAELDPLVR